MTTGSPLSGEIGDSPISWVTIANKIVWRVCFGSLAAQSPELGVFSEATSEDLQKLTEEHKAYQHLTRPLVGTIRKPGVGVEDW